MALSVVRLKREYEIRVWRKIIEENPYIAVVQATGGGSWGRTNMKARILGEHHRKSQDIVGARYAVPKSAREGALRTGKYSRLASLFQTASSAVVYGTKVEPVVDVVKQATKLIDGAILIGGRFGDDVITARTWKEVLESEGEMAEWMKFISVLNATPPFIPILEQNATGLAQIIDQASHSNQLVNVLRQMGEKDSKEQIVDSS